MKEMFPKWGVFRSSALDKKRPMEKGKNRERMGKRRQKKKGLNSFGANHSIRKLLEKGNRGAPANSSPRSSKIRRAMWGDKSRKRKERRKRKKQHKKKIRITP